MRGDGVERELRVGEAAGRVMGREGGESRSTKAARDQQAQNEPSV